MKDSILRTKAIDFAADIVNFYEDFLLLKKDNTIAKQLLRSATSIGANLMRQLLAIQKRTLYQKCILH
ncbi:MAG: four helix bundle protein [Clostridiales bacterium]|nr:four helix bundle protein [Clostridiales bacterium]